MMSDINYENRDCSYCGNKMQIAKSRIKRVVPQGAKDLGLFDETICWKCPRCGQSTTEGMEICNCGSLILSRDNHAPALDAYAEDTPCLQVKLYSLMSNESITGVGNEFRCTACLPCYECRQPLNTYDFVRDKEYDAILRDDTRRDHQPIIQMTFAFFHQACVDAKKAVEAEKQRQKEEENARRREGLKEKVNELRKVEREKQRRIKAGLCIMCGSSLGFTDKIAKRQSHKRC